MSAPSHRTPSVRVHPFDAPKKAEVFFSEKPWDAMPAFDPRQWQASRFFDLFRDDDQMGDADSPTSGVSRELRDFDAD